MRILYLHQFFITRDGVGGTRSYEFARRFVAHGHAVRMLTAGSGRRVVDGIEVVGVRGGYADYVRATGVSYARRMLAFGRFAAAMCVATLRGPRPDVVFATSPPLTIALPALVASMRWRAPLVFEVRDLWPEAPIQMGALRNRAVRSVARRLEELAYRRAVRVVALSPGIRDGAMAAGARHVAVIPNASDLELFSPSVSGAATRERLGLGDRFVVAYFGTMGEANDLSQVVDAAALLPDVAFVLMGDGKLRAALEARAESNVTFTGPGASKAEVAELAAAAGCCLTIFRDIPILSTNSPNKLFDTFAAGRPAIVNMDGWMRELVERNEAGLYARAGDPADLARQIARLRDDPALAARMGENARALAEREFDRDMLAERLLGVLKDAAAR